mmetsp:Transcript_120249/g.291758  ORF Transcript_120249/g.291758 Transcript_120249/m.291758 type:complete len:268 (-) Transcript_120249:175-978(-)
MPDVHDILCATLEEGEAGEEHGRSLLIEAYGNVAQVIDCMPQGEARDADALLARRVAVAALELQEALPGGRGPVRLLPDVKVECDGRVFVQGTESPLARAALSNLRLSHATAVLAPGGEAADGTTTLEVVGCKDLDLCTKAMLQMPIVVALKDFPEGVLEDVQAERVRHHHVTSSLLGKHLHLVQPHLVQRAGEDVHRAARRRRARGQAAVEVQGRPRARGLAPLEVEVGPHRLPQLLAHDGARPHVAGPPGQQHDPRAALRAGGLE